VCGGTVTHTSKCVRKVFVVVVQEDEVCPRRSFDSAVASRIPKIVVTVGNYDDLVTRA
jgi:hypothetical protein